ncbi:hypothetical protein NMG60_11024277 [Bertholletia excelsa]
MGSDNLVHILVSFSGQGHVNPLLPLGKCLACQDLILTFSRPESIDKDICRPIWLMECLVCRDGFFSI